MFLLCLPVVTQDDNTNVVRLQVKGHTFDTRVEFNHLTCLYFGESENTSDTVSNWDDRAEFFQIILSEWSEHLNYSNDLSEPQMAVFLWKRVIIVARSS